MLDAGGRYRTFVQPDHPLVEELLCTASKGRQAPDVSIVVDILRLRAVYSDARGRRSFDDLLAEYHVTGKRAMRMNCINATCLAASMLRRAGCSPNEVFVALGGRRGLGHFHAWVLVVLPVGMLWIDPTTLAPRTVSGDWIAQEHVLHVIFNDYRFIFDEPGRRALLTGDTP